MLKSNIFVIGFNSRLSRCLAAEFSITHNIIFIEKEVYGTWLKKPKKISEYFVNNIKNNDILILTKAILNKNLNKAFIYDINYFFPKNIINALDKIKKNLKIFTFGSIHEHSKIINNYLESKRKLTEFITNFNSNYLKIFHFRLHTIYGYGTPIKEMFLGQIYNSIKNDFRFDMSHGNQLRQYHNYHDISKIIFHLTSQNKLKMFNDISGDEYLKLKTIALELFTHFNKLELLNIGKISTDSNEIINDNYIKNKDIPKYFFRDSIKGLIEYFENELIK